MWLLLFVLANEIFVQLLYISKLKFLVNATEQQIVALI